MMSTISAGQPVQTPASKLSLADKYRAIEAAVFAGQDQVTLGEGQDQLPVQILATGGKHAAFRGKTPDDVRYRTIVTEEGGYPGKAYLVTYQLGSADGVDNMLHVTSVEENPDWARTGQAPATTQTVFGTSW
ncbi:MAG: hypothetical protein ACYCW6_06065 [Candidatus Xenobia bacterium]